MNHKQTGYQSAWTTPTTFVAILHGTCVLRKVWRKREGIDEFPIPYIEFNSGGYHTRSTAKAINGALKELQMDNWFKAHIKCETLVVTNLKTQEVVELNDSAEFLLT